MYAPNRERWMCRYMAVAALLLGLHSVPLQAQSRNLPFNEREIEAQGHAFDKPDVWTLTLRFKDPRVITVDVPGRGKKIVWYLWYQVINLTGEPRMFIPDFELKTNDYETLHPDEVMPYVQQVISKIEDPTGKLDIKNSVTISKEPIPISKKDAFPRAVTGVAIWTDIYDRAPKTNNFSIFVAGLSDGWKEDPNTKIIRRKTLQINFRRYGDEYQNDSNAIRWVDNPQWIYRSTDANLRGGPAPKAMDKEKAIIEPISSGKLNLGGIPERKPPLTPADNSPIPGGLAEENPLLLPVPPSRVSNRPEKRH